MCPCRDARVLSATVEVIAILVNSKACARACVVLELAQVRDWQSQLLAVPRSPVLNHLLLIVALDVEKPVVCPKELRNARGVQLRNLRLEGAHSISSSSGIEACRRECPCWPTTVLEMHGMVCES